LNSYSRGWKEYCSKGYIENTRQKFKKRGGRGRGREGGEGRGEEGRGKRRDRRDRRETIKGCQSNHTSKHEPLIQKGKIQSNKAAINTAPPSFKENDQWNRMEQVVKQFKEEALGLKGTFRVSFEPWVEAAKGGH